jgi:nicotinamidase/pyrazinamidase
MQRYDQTVALILVDLQNDFLPGGALAVADGDATVRFANGIMGQYHRVLATQDWHPADHRSFARAWPGRSPGEVVELEGLPQVLWPVHCVQGSPGAQFAADLDQSRIEAVFQKGQDPAIDSYSGFFDNGYRRDTGLAAWLRERGVHEVHILGLATDYCVKATALDARKEGFAVTLLQEGCRGVELAPGNIARALAEMNDAGVLMA